MSGADERARHDAMTDERMRRARPTPTARRGSGSRHRCRITPPATAPGGMLTASATRRCRVSSCARQAGLPGASGRSPKRSSAILGDVAGLTTVELGCGAAQWSIALARAGATAIGVDLSEAQLRAAWAAASEAGVAVRLIHASAEALPLPDASADIAFCDWGASRFADPDAWVPEAARILRPGGLLAFSTASPLVDMCWATGADAPTESLVIDAFGLDRVVDDETTEFQRTNGAWIALFRAQGLLVEDLIELQAPADATSSYWDDVAHAWARRWPAEQIWRLRRES